INRCVGVNECLRRVLGNREVTCALNPVAGRERQWGEGTLRRVSPAEAKRVVVIGGGLAGMRAAAVAARRGHQASLIAAHKELGGHLNLLKHLPTRKDWQIAIDGFQRALERSSVELRLGVEATPETVAHERPDAVVCATGAAWDNSGFSPQRPERPGIPGA